MALNFLPPYYSYVNTGLVPYIFYYTQQWLLSGCSHSYPQIINIFYIEVIEINQLRADSEAKEYSGKTASTVAISLTRWENLMVAHLGENLPVCYVRYFPEKLRLTVSREILVHLWRIVWQYALLINETDYTQNHIQKVNRKQSNRSLKSGWTLKLSDGIKTTKWAYLICIFYSDVLVRSFFHSESSLHIKAFSHFSEIRMFLERNPKCKLNCGLSIFFFTRLTT